MNFDQWLCWYYWDRCVLLFTGPGWSCCFARIGCLL